MLTNLFAPVNEALAPWPLKLPLMGLHYMARMFEECGLTFAAAGMLGTVLLYCTLRVVVSIRGSIPMTPGVEAGLGLWVAFLLVTLVHTPIDALLHFSKRAAVPHG